MDKAKRSQDNDIAIIDLKNSTAAESDVLQNMPNSGNKLEKIMSTKITSSVILRDSAMKHVDD